MQQSVIQNKTQEVIQLQGDGKLLFKDSSGTAFVTFGGSPKLTIEDNGIFNIKGSWQLDGTTITADAASLNNAGKLASTTEGSEGATAVATRASAFVNYAPSENNVQAALEAIDLTFADKMTAPAISGNNGQYLQTNGSGVLSWADVSGGGGFTVTDGSHSQAIDSGIL